MKAAREQKKTSEDIPEEIYSLAEEIFDLFYDYDPYSYTVCEGYREGVISETADDIFYERGGFTIEALEESFYDKQDEKYYILAQALLRRLKDIVQKSNYKMNAV